MANGMEGISVQDLGIRLVLPQFGMVSISVGTLNQQYFAPVFGIQAINVNVTSDKSPGTKKTVKHF